MQDFLYSHFGQGLLGNSWERWAASASITAGILILSLVLRGLLAARLRAIAHKTETKWDDVALLAIDRTSLLFLLALALHFGTHSLDLHPNVEKVREGAFFLFLFFQLGSWITCVLQFFGNAQLNDALERDPARATTLSALILLADIAVWTTMFLLLLANFGVNVSALVAGLGIGGVAVALAVQSILGDLFASLSIVLDKPFVIGDSIHVNGLSGTVEHIGLKTTRIRSVTGEQLIFSNSDLLKGVVKNFKRMERRRVTFAFGLIYETSPALLQKARALVKEAVERQKNATFDRCHLATLAASSLDFEVVYWVGSSDYNDYVNTHHEILVSLVEIFGKAGLEFAYPHQVSLQKTANAPHAHA